MVDGQCDNSKPEDLLDAGGAGPEAMRGNVLGGVLMLLQQRLECSGSGLAVELTGRRCAVTVT